MGKNGEEERTNDVIVLYRPTVDVFTISFLETYKRVFIFVTFFDRL